jgi:hypothetical protein
MCSLGWSLFTLCLTIYFATQATTFADLPEEYKDMMTPEEITKARLILFFNIGWSVLQIIVAFFYILIICYVGTTINEGVSGRIISCWAVSAKIERQFLDAIDNESCVVDHA